MDAFTCISCRVAFKDGEIQRSHYKTEWHRYNLKRKIAELPPITAEDFQKRALTSQKNSSEVIEDNSTSIYCNVCRKSFASQNAYENHLNSKKHKEKSVIEDPSVQNSDQSSTSSAKARGPVDTRSTDRNYDTDSEIEEVDSDEWDEDMENAIDQDKCLFCMYHSDSLIERIQHMSVEHSFFIPDVEYCIDMEGLLSYLARKINCDFMCIWCSEKGRMFHSAEAAHNHMLDKGHCKMLHDGVTIAEYSDYYDYSSSYPDHSTDVDKNSEVCIPELDDSDYQLVLPSGSVIGHRSLMRYYKQNIDPGRAVTLSQNTKKLNKVLAGYRALGWTATQEEVIARKARDLRYMQRLQSKYNMKLGVKGNKLQKYCKKINL